MVLLVTNKHLQCFQEAISINNRLFHHENFKSSKNWSEISRGAIVLFLNIDCVHITFHSDGSTKWKRTGKLIRLKLDREGKMEGLRPTRCRVSSTLKLLTSARFINLVNL